MREQITDLEGSGEATEVYSRCNGKSLECSGQGMMVLEDLSGQANGTMWR